MRSSSRRAFLRRLEGEHEDAPRQPEDHRRCRDGKPAHVVEDPRPWVGDRMDRQWPVRNQEEIVRPDQACMFNEEHPWLSARIAEANAELSRRRDVSDVLAVFGGDSGVESEAERNERKAVEGARLMLGVA